MRIGLFFGSFNPIHLGHTQLAKWILSTTSLSEIWLVVSPNNPLKEAHTLLDEQIRYQMAEAACKEANEQIQDTGKQIRPCDVEFTLPRPNYTYLTLQKLSQEHPEDELVLIMGSDNLAIFDKWREHDWIRLHYPIYVYPREGDNIEKLKADYPEITILQGAPLFRISATEIRQAAAVGNREVLDRWLCKEVKQTLETLIRL